jgi:phosphomannomutase/phosphoglucomutase
MGGYDVRGLAMPRGDKTPTLSPEIMLHLGAAIGSRLNVGATVFVTRDGRLTSPDFQEAIIQGLLQTGVNVVETKDTTPTGAATWFVINQKEKIAAGMVVSGSHNPKEDNGVKISIGGEALYGAELKELIPVIENGEYRIVPAEQQGKRSVVDVTSQYLSMLEHAYPKLDLSGTRIVYDAGDGIGGVLVPFLRNRGAEVEARNIVPDGNFPAYGQADPSKPSCVDPLSAVVKAANQGEARKWVGLMIDGDADRSGFITESGRVFWPDKMAAIFYKDYLEKLSRGELPDYFGPHMAMDVRASSSATTMVFQLGGVGMFIPAGYPSHRAWARLIAPEIGKTKATGTSAEASGHFFYPTALIGADGAIYEPAKDFLVDDGLYSALMLLQIQKETGLTLDAMMALIPDLPSSREIWVEVADDSKKFDIVEQIKRTATQRYADQMRPLGKGVMNIGTMRVQDTNEGLILVDGVRVQFRDGSFGLVRASNTSPMLTLRFEATESGRLVALMEDFEGNLLKPFGDQIKIAGVRAEIEYQKKQFGLGG